MNQQNDAQTAQTESQQSTAAKVLSRRKFLLQASAVSVPAVLSLKSGKAWGCVELNCTPGEVSLSNSGSQVASVSEGPNKVYERPQWSSISRIISAFDADFCDWLLSTYYASLCTYTTKKQGKTTYYKYDKLTCGMYDFDNWWNKVKKGSSTAVVTNSSTTNWVTTSPKSYNKSNSRMPGNYKNVLIKHDTDANKVCPGILGKVGDVLKGRDCPEKYAMAAIIGSIWERHPEYIARYGSDWCFPSPQELIDAFAKAKLEGRLAELHSLFKLYMSPL